VQNTVLPPRKVKPQVKSGAQFHKTTNVSSWLLPALVVSINNKLCPGVTHTHPHPHAHPHVHTRTHTHTHTNQSHYITYRFNKLLCQIVQSDRLVGSDIFHLLNELSGTLYCHCGKYLLSHHTKVHSTVSLFYYHLLSINSCQWV